MPAPPQGFAWLAATYLGTVTGTDQALGVIQRAVDDYNASIAQTGMRVVGTPTRYPSK